MERSELLEKVAPCSLICYTCSGCSHGIICESSKTLLKYLEGIKEFYEKHIPDAVEGYCNFEGVLRMYCDAPCSGCRSMKHKGCSIEGCFCLNVQRTMASIFAENAKNFHVKKYIHCLKKQYTVSG